MAYVDQREIASIEGLDEQTAEELQNRAREYLDRAAQELDQRRVELGVLDELKEIEGLTPQMLVALGEADIKSIEDLAGCASDDLIGWTERKDGQTTKHKVPSRSRDLGGRGERPDHAGPRQGRLDRGAGRGSGAEEAESQG